MILLGVIGTFLPAAPGVILVFGGMLLGAWIDGFRRTGWVTLTILGVLTILALLGDMLGALIGAKRVGRAERRCAGPRSAALRDSFSG